MTMLLASRTSRKAKPRNSSRAGGVKDCEATAEGGDAEGIVLDAAEHDERMRNAERAPNAAASPRRVGHNGNGNGNGNGNRHGPGFDNIARVFGMTRGEIALVAFIFCLVYGAIVLPRLAERIGVRDDSKKP